MTRVKFYRGPFAGRERSFILRIGEVGELERLCNAGIGMIALRLSTHQFYVADVREAIRLALQGGGLGEPEATALVMSSIDENPLADHLDLAANIVQAYLNGLPEPLKKKEQAESDQTPSSPEISPDGTASEA